MIGDLPAPRLGVDETGPERGLSRQPAGRGCKAGVRHPRIDYFNSPDDRANALSENQLKEVRGIIYQVDELVAGALPIPKHIILDTTREWQDPCYQSDCRAVLVPYWTGSPGSGEGTQAEVDRRRALVAHEYAHVILTDYAEQHFQSLNVMAAMEREKQRLNDNDKIPRSMGDRQRDDCRYAELTSRILEAKIMLAGYHELFADCVPVLLAGNLKAVRNAVEGRCKLQGHPEWAVARDFSISHSPESWMAQNEHFFFSPARGVLGGMGVERSELGRKRTLIKSLAETVDAELVGLLDNPKRSRDQGAVNKSLVTALEERLRRNQVPLAGQQDDSLETLEPGGGRHPSEGRAPPRSAGVSLPRSLYEDVDGGMKLYFYPNNTVEILNSRGESGRYSIDPTGQYVTLVFKNRTMTLSIDHDDSLMGPNQRKFVLR